MLAVIGVVLVSSHLSGYNIIWVHRGPWIRGVMGPRCFLEPCPPSLGSRRRPLMLITMPIIIVLRIPSPTCMNFHLDLMICFFLCLSLFWSRNGLVRGSAIPKYQAVASHGDQFRTVFDDFQSIVETCFCFDPYSHPGR